MRPQPQAPSARTRPCEGVQHVAFFFIFVIAALVGSCLGPGLCALRVSHSDPACEARGSQ
uniref:Uncharacterized protein n=1 Tax=Thermogemmatispora argillosa TaxID=2045280 RepID=A0A455SXV6_9CHLR|nr:hypothetical protein KTA_02000 [Thermogemmatispora argillosa]